jgi:hypothetical protein
MQQVVTGEGKMQQGKQQMRANGVVVRTVQLIAANGVAFDDVPIRGDKNLPEVILWGVYDGQRVFLRDGKVYRECSWIQAVMPELRSL